MAKSKVAGAALKGLGKAFLKRRATISGAKSALKALGGKPIGAADLVRKAPSVSTFRARREVLRGVKAPEKPGYKTGAATGVAATLAALKIKERKEAKAKETKAHKDELKKSIEEHKKKTKEKRIKYGKHQD